MRFTLAHRPHAPAFLRLFFQSTQVHLDIGRGVVIAIEHWRGRHPGVETFVHTHRVDGDGYTYSLPDGRPCTAYYKVEILTDGPRPLPRASCPPSPLRMACGWRAEIWPVHCIADAETAANSTAGSFAHVHCNVSHATSSDGEDGVLPAYDVTAPWLAEGADAVRVPFVTSRGRVWESARVPWTASYLVRATGNKSVPDRAAPFNDARVIGP